MSSIKTQSTKKINWTQFLRPKVGDVVNHNGSDWVSVNGKNSEPSESNSDWGKVGGDSGGINEVLDVENQVDAGKSLQFKETTGNDLFRIISLGSRNFFLQTVDAATNAPITVLSFTGNFIGLNDGKYFRFIGNGNSQDLKPNESTSENTEITMPLEGGVLLVDAPDDKVRYLRRENVWVNARQKNHRRFAGTFGSPSLIDTDEIIVFSENSEGSFNLPDPTDLDGLELKFIFERFSEIQFNRDVVSNISNSVNLITQNTNIAIGSYTIIASNDVWKVLHFNQEL